MRIRPHLTDLKIALAVCCKRLQCLHGTHKPSSEQARNASTTRAILDMLSMSLRSQARVNKEAWNKTIEVYNEAARKVRTAIHR